MIDFHVHLFPDAIAAGTVKKLAAEAGIEPHGDGSLASLRSVMKEDGVRIAVNQPVATKSGQVTAINRKMVALQASSPDIRCFGGMHPAFPSPEEEIAFLAANGIRGIKMHPDYQSFHPDDPALAPLYEACRRHGLMILFHAGLDLAYEYTHGTPRRFAEVAKVEGLTIALAHLGGYRMWDDVERHLVGRKLFLETSFSHELEAPRLKEIIAAHSADRVLFGTDWPWQRPAAQREIITRLGLPEDDEGKILDGNAAKLLGLAPID